MSLPSDLVELMNDEIVLEPALGLDRYNNFTFGPPATHRCYLSRTNKRALTREGREIITTVQAILADPEVTVTANDRLTLPDGSKPAIVQVLAAPDENGQPFYLEVQA